MSKLKVKVHIVRGFSVELLVLFHVYWHCCWSFLFDANAGVPADVGFGFGKLVSARLGICRASTAFTVISHTYIYTYIYIYT